MSLTFDLGCMFTTESTIDLITSEQLFSGVTVTTSLLAERLTHRPSDLDSSWPQMTACFLQIVSKRLQLFQLQSSQKMLTKISII